MRRGYAGFRSLATARERPAARRAPGLLRRRHRAPCGQGPPPPWRTRSARPRRWLDEYRGPWSQPPIRTRRLFLSQPFQAVEARLEIRADSRGAWIFAERSTCSALGLVVA